MTLPDIDRDLIGALGRAGYVVVPKSCVAPQLLGRALKVRTVPPADRELAAVRLAAAERHGLTVEDLTGPGVKRHVSAARQIAMYVAVEHFGKRRGPVAFVFGRRDMSNVRHAVLRVREQLADTGTRRHTEEIVGWVVARAQVLIEAGDS